MSLPITLKFSQMLILVGDGGSPEVFAAPCGLTARSFEFGSEVKEYAVIGDDWTEAEAGALSGTLSGNGVLAVESFAVWNNWALSRQPRNVHIKLDGIGSYIGAFLLTQLSLQGSQSGGRVSIEVSMVSSGALVLQIEGNYSDTITPSVVPINGQTITPVFSHTGIGYSDTISASSLPITGQTITPVFFHAGTYSDTIAPSALPISGQTKTPIHSAGGGTAGQMFGFFFPITKAT